MKNIQIYPNPFTDEIKFNLSGYQGEINISLFDINGRIVYNDFSKTNDKSLHLGFLKSGVYFLQLTSQNSTYINKIVKQP